MAVTVFVTCTGHDPYCHEYEDHTYFLTVKVDAMGDFGIDPNESYRYCLLYEGAECDDMDPVDEYGPGPTACDLWERYHPGAGAG